MAEKLNQHYVPQFYFRYFSIDNKSICLLNRKTGITVETAPIKGQASKNKFYGEKIIEDNLSEIEGIHSAALKSVKCSNDFESCSKENHLLILQNIMMQKSRTASERIKWKKMQDTMLQLQMECDINNDSTISEESKIEYRNDIKNYEANPKHYQLHNMMIAMEYASSLIDLLPVILHNKTKYPFIFSDSPVIMTNPLLKQVTLTGVLGTQTPGLIVLYPISTKHCIMLIDHKSYKIIKYRSSAYPVRDYRDIDLLNKLQIHNSEGNVYFSDYRYKDYVINLWRKEKNKLVDHLAKLIEAPAILNDGEPMGDIIHSFEEQLPLVPRLSFLKYEEIPESKYKFRIRNNLF